MSTAPNNGAAPSYHSKINFKRMNKYFKYIISLGILLTTGFNSFSQDTLTTKDTLTLAECRAMALDYNKQLKLAHYQSQEAEQNKKVARTAYLPTLSADGTLMHRPESIEFNTAGGFLPTAESEADALAGNYSGLSNVYSPGMSMSMDNLTLFMGGLSLEQPIFTGGKIYYSNKQADLGVEMTKYAYELKHDEVIELIDKAFWQVAMVEANIKLAESYITMLKELEEQMIDMYDLGLSPASEKLKVSVQKNDAELQLMKAKNGLRISKMYLNQVIGRDLNAEVNIFYDNPETNLFDMANGVDMALTNRNELKLMNKQIELSEYDKKIARSDYLPTAGVSLQYSTFYVSDIYEDGGFSPMIAGKVSIPLFAWGQGVKKQKAAEFVIKQKEEELNRTNDLISLEVMQVQVQIEEAYEEISIAKENISEAEESLDETKASFDVGLNTTTDLLNAQADWQNAKSQLISAVANFKLLETQWAKVTGTLYSAK